MTFPGQMELPDMPPHPEPEPEPPAPVEVDWQVLAGSARLLLEYVRRPTMGLPDNVDPYDWVLHRADDWAVRSALSTLMRAAHYECEMFDTFDPERTAMLAASADSQQRLHEEVVRTRR